MADHWRCLFVHVRAFCEQNLGGQVVTKNDIVTEAVRLPFFHFAQHEKSMHKRTPESPLSEKDVLSPPAHFNHDNNERRKFFFLLLQCLSDLFYFSFDDHLDHHESKKKVFVASLGPVPQR
jgi:hypothetical protein